MLAATAVAALGACTGPQVEVRQLASPIEQGDIAIAERLAEAHGQMRLGNVGLAIESYRKALRKHPRSALAHVGIAAAYDRMGRYDISLDHYQVALALQPDDPRLYVALAGSLRAQGRPVDAARVMAEAKARQLQATQGEALASAETRPPAEFLGPPSAPELVAGSINILPKPIRAEAVTRGLTVRLPQPRRVEAVDAPELSDPNIVAPAGELPEVHLVTLERETVPSSGRRPDAPRLVDEGLRMRAGTMPVVELRTLDKAVDIADLPRSQARAKPELTAAPLPMTRMVLAAPEVTHVTPVDRTIPLAPAPKLAMAAAPLPVVNAGPAPAVRDLPLGLAETVGATPKGDAVMLQAPLPQKERAPLPATKKRTSARLERMTSGEVALVTTTQPLWEKRPRTRPGYTSQVVERTPTSTTVQFTRARVEATPVVLIAAGATVRLAEAARTRLEPQGVRVVETGGSPTARRRSVLFYPKGREEDAKALVASLGFRVAAQVGPVTTMTLHLGSDAQAALAVG